MLRHRARRGRRWVGPRAALLPATTALLLGAAALLPLSAGAAGRPSYSFCDYGVVRHYAKPLAKMPPLRRAPTRQDLPFGPGHVTLNRLAQHQVMLPPDRKAKARFARPVGYGISIPRNGNVATKAVRPFHWLVTATLAKVNARGRELRVLDSIRKRVRWPRPRSDSFPLSPPKQPGFYRLEIVFRNAAGKRLRAYGEYIRVLRPRLDVRLSLNATSFHPGDRVVPRLDNYGASLLFYGEIGAYYERFDGSQWVYDELVSGGAKLAFGRVSAPGMSAACWRRKLPASTPPGLYRFHLGLVYFPYWQWVLRERDGHPLDLTAEFQVLPPG